MDEPIDPRVLAAAMPALPEPAAVVEAIGAGGGTRHRISWHNEAFNHLLGTSASLRGLDPLRLGIGGGAQALGALLLSGAAGALDLELRRTDGSTLAARVAVSPLGELDGVRRWTLVAHERMAVLRAKESLQASEAQFQALAEQAPIGIFRSDVGLRLGYANARCAEILGRPVAELLGQGWLEALAGEDRARVRRAAEHVLEGGEVDLDQIRVARADGSPRWVSIRVAPVRTAAGAPGFVGSLEDVTERRLLEEALAHDATHDRLTGLPNRSVLWEHLQTELDHPELHVAVLSVDLDDFKLINDSLGHDAGDHLLLAVADRLAEAVRPHDLVARFGADEFVVVCAGIHDRSHAEHIASRLAESVRAPFDIAGREIGVTVSVGLVVADRSCRDPEALLRDADVALHQAKAAGKARWALFDERAREGASQRLAMASELRRAIDEGRLSVHYQPIVDLITGRTVAVEALARWEGGTSGPVPPAQFISLAEDMGMIEHLGAWVLRASCRQLARWRRHLGEIAPEHVSVNLSVRQLGDPTLVDLVLEVLRAERLEPHRLCLELTESVFMDDIEHAVSLLAELKAFGIGLAMDDFGTGYSSLSSLRRFPGDVLKIDRAFVAGVEHESAGTAIISAVVSLARAVGLEPVAEGIETPAEVELLRSLGVRLGQGYHLARPMAPAAFEHWLLSRRAEVRR